MAGNNKKHRGYFSPTKASSWQQFLIGVILTGLLTGAGIAIGNAVIKGILKSKLPEGHFLRRGAE
jgi:hypothetical protein